MTKNKHHAGSSEGRASSRGGENGEDEVFVGVDLGATNVRAAAVRGSEPGTVQSAAIDAGGSVEDVMDRMYDVIDEVWSDDVAGIGVGVPSVVDVEEGIVYDVQNIPSMTEVPIKDLLEERFDRPAFVNNDVNCFVLGEYAFGKARGFRHVAGCNIGTGFAAGLLLDGRLYEGPNCGAGEFGMIPYMDSILENYCSGLFFIRQGLDAAEQHDAARAGDAEAVELWHEFGGHLGKAMQIVMYTVDPQIIVLGGSIRRAYDLFQETMWEELRRFAYGKTLERLTFELSDLDNAGLLGAARLPAKRSGGP